MFTATATSSQRGVHERAAEARRAARSRWRAARRRPGPTTPATASRTAARCAGLGDVELEHRRRRRQLAGGALGERQAPAGAGEHDLGALLLGQLRPRRRPSEASVRTPVMTMCLPSSRPMARTVATACDDRAGRCRVQGSAPMRIGILGGTGPAGTALGARLASVGYEVVIGSRSKDRAVEVRDEHLGRWPDLQPAHRARPTTTAPPTADVVVIATPWDGAAHHRPGATPASSPARSSSRWPTPSCASATSSSRSCRPAARWPPTCRPRCPDGRVVAAFHHVPAKELGEPRPADRLRRADLRRRPDGHEGGGRDRRQDPRLPPARRRRALQRHGHRGVHRRAAAAQRALQDPGGASSSPASSRS